MLIEHHQIDMTEFDEQVEIDMLNIDVDEVDHDEHLHHLEMVDHELIECEVEVELDLYEVKIQAL